jgi:hypothetical protein
VTTARRLLTSYPARLLLAVVLVVGGAAAAFHLGLAGNTERPQGQAQAAPTAVPGQIADGTWLVGTDVQPGTYRSAGAGPDGYCMWSRHNTASGGPMDGIIASDGSYDARQMIVTIAPGDKVFRTSGCAPFTKVG